MIFLGAHQRINQIKVWPSVRQREISSALDHMSKKLLPTVKYAQHFPSAHSKKRYNISQAPIPRSDGNEECRFGMPCASRRVLVPTSGRMYSVSINRYFAQERAFGLSCAISLNHREGTCDDAATLLIYFAVSGQHKQILCTGASPRTALCISFNHHEGTGDPHGCDDAPEDFAVFINKYSARERRFGLPCGSAVPVKISPHAKSRVDRLKVRPFSDEDWLISVAFEGAGWMKCGAKKGRADDEKAKSCTLR
ncbi:hypothetical protein DFH29DRAFT_876370 [Suillus ampliporus]|nr:hypothetical protein DFH29DRAFT_876370 [Suillus ampliporus]